MKLKAIIFYNPSNKNNILMVEKIEKFLTKKAIGVLKISVGEKKLCNISGDFSIAVGGDGTVLYAARSIVDKEIPLISIKCGGLGFLSSVEEKNAYQMIEDFLCENYKTVNRTLLKLVIGNKKFIALNDIVIKSNDFRTFYTDVYYFDEYISSYFSDGVIFSTPTGSTAYSLSCGGPIVHTHSKVIIITPISPHTLTHRPVILPDTTIIKVKARPKHGSEKSIILSIDGQENIKYPGDFLEISVYDKFLKSIVLKNYSYFELLRKKLSWGERND
jgi:NAD+ kinase